jgi:hypothetical protein
MSWLYKVWKKNALGDITSVTDFFSSNETNYIHCFGEPMYAFWGTRVTLIIFFRGKAEIQNISKTDSRSQNQCWIKLIRNCWTEMLARSLGHIIILVHFLGSHFEALESVLLISFSRLCLDIIWSNWLSCPKIPPSGHQNSDVYRYTLRLDRKWTSIIIWPRDRASILVQQLRITNVLLFRGKAEKKY